MLKFAKSIGGNTDQLTSQAFVFTPSSLEALTRFSLSILISGEGDDVFVKIRQAATSLEDQYLKSDLTVQEEFSAFLQQLQLELAAVESLQILLAGWKENIFYLQSKGQHQAYLFRNNQLTNLTNQAPEGQFISGFIEPADQILLIASLTNNQGLVKRLLKTDLEALDDEVNAHLAESSVVEPIAVVSLKVPLPPTSESHPKLTNQPKLTLPKLNKLNLSFVQKKVFLRVFWALGALVLLAVLFIKIKPFSRFSKPPQQSNNRTVQQSPQPNNSFTVNDFSVFLDLNLIKPGFTTTRLSYSLGKLLLMDPSTSNLVVLDLSAKNPLPLAGSTQLGKAAAFSLNGDFAFAYSDDKGITRIDVNSQKNTLAVKPDPDWGKIKDLVGFGSNIYLLDSVKNQIWKYVPVATGYSDKFTYLDSNQKADFLGALRMEIDSSVWVLKPNLEILKFTQGLADNFSVSGLDKNLSSVTNFFVSDETDNIYLLDSDNSRLVVLTKSGKYVAQYSDDKFKTATDLVVDEKNKKVYLLNSDKIFQFSLH